jgi:hypothetical protein
MKKPAAFLLTLLLLSSCTRPPTLPLAPQAGQSLAHKGCLHITLMDLTQTATGVTGLPIQALQPDGSVLLQNVGSVEAGQPTVRFDSLDQAGTYQYAFAGQAAAAPLWKSAVLSRAAPAYEGQLQVAGASLLLQGPQNMPYPYLGATYYLSVQNQPAGDRGMDLALAMDGLPPGGEAVFTPAFLRSGQSAELRLSIPAGTMAASLTLTVQGYVGSQLAAQALPLHPAKDWDLSLTCSLGNLAAYSNGGAYSLSATARLSATGRNIPLGTALRLQYQGMTLLGYGPAASSSGSIMLHSDYSSSCAPAATVWVGGTPTDLQLGVNGTAGWDIASVLGADKKLWWLFQYSFNSGDQDVPFPIYCNWCSVNSCSQCEGAPCF